MAGQPLLSPSGFYRSRSWQCLLLAVAASLLATPGGFAQEESPSASPAPSIEITKEIALRAIAAFTEDPTGQRGRAAIAVFTRFAQDSKDVTVQVSPKLVPWFGNQSAPNQQERNRLFGAYIAGNARSQLQRGAPQDDPLAGWQQVFATYAQLQAAQAGLLIPEVETLLSEQRAGTLRARADEALKSPPK